jgi:glyoxylase-like metal-dependent hydrolase (beta-lactamase superfamily II)
MEVKLIDIEQDIPGFEGFFGSWFYRDNNLAFLVDLGPVNAGKKLISSLNSMGVDKIDYILLTHIHIDHAGPLADILEHFPMAKAICHEKGLQFLVDPSKLWEGSLKVLGKYAEAYGPPKPVKTEKLIAHHHVEINGLQILETPGHAPHHLSYTYGDRLFSGEAAGNYFQIKGRPYFRPATPPRFFLKVFLESVDRLLALDDLTICYAHCGSVKSSHTMLKLFREQLLHWEEILFKEFQKGDNRLLERCVNALLNKDENLGAYYEMSAQMQQRERIFLANSVNGFIGYFKEKASMS